MAQRAGRGSALRRALRKPLRSRLAEVKFGCFPTRQHRLQPVVKFLIQSGRLDFVRKSFMVNHHDQGLAGSGRRAGDSGQLPRRLAGLHNLRQICQRGCVGR